MNYIASHIHMWGIGTEILLMLSVIYLAVRIVKSPDRVKNLNKLVELNTSLEALIREAEAAGKGLNDQLMKRQNNLEKLLSDLYGVEQRLNRSNSFGEEIKAKIDREEKKLDEKLNTLRGEVERIRNEVEVAKESASTLTKHEDQKSARRIPETETTEFRHGIASNQNEPQAATSGRVSKVPHQENQARNSIEQEIEREITRETRDDISRIEHIAEQMLLRGTDIRSIADITNLSVQHIRSLSQKVLLGETDQTAHRESKTDIHDSRLGVLSPVKRQVQTL